MNGAGSQDLTIQLVRSQSSIDATTKLIWEFFDHLRERYSERRDDIDAYIENQDISGQIAAFSTRLGPPAGECLLGLVKEDPMGIVMPKRVDEDLCEMNRLYVRDAARGLGLGRRRVERLLSEAKSLGYTRMRLDAWDRHEEALPLYESCGFEYYSEPGKLAEILESKPVQMRRSL